MSYGGGGGVYNLLPEPLSNRQATTITELCDNPIRVEERTDEEFDPVAGATTPYEVMIPIFVDPASEGDRRTRDAIRRAAELCEAWISEHHDCFPPVVINMTTGEPEDGDLRQAMDALCRHSTYDGNVLLGHCLFTPGGEAVQFPSQPDELPEHPVASALFDTASELPEWYHYNVANLFTRDRPLGPKARLFTVNADPMIICCATYFNPPALSPADPIR